MSGEEKNAMAGRRILLVDDDDTFLGLLKELFAGEGYETNSVASGEDAICELEKNGYDAAIVDLNLAGWISGLDLLRGIRGRYPEMKVIVCSGQGDKITVAEVLKLEVVSFVEKPINDLNRFLEMVRKALGNNNLSSIAKKG